MKGSGVRVPASALANRRAFMFDVRAGKVTRLASYTDRERSRADLSLSPNDCGP